MIQLEQFLAIEGLVRADPRFIEACRKRGIDDITKVCVDPWSAGNFDIPGEEGRHLCHLCHIFAWLRLREHENFYAHPIEGLNAVIDLKSGEVIRVDDYGITPIPMTEINYEAQFNPHPRQPFKPLDVVQPEGVSFQLAGRHLTWDRWSVRIGFSACTTPSARKTSPSNPSSEPASNSPPAASSPKTPPSTSPGA